MTQSEFEHIATQLRSVMLKIARDFFGSLDEAEDIAQEAMVQLWHYCEHIDPKQNVTGLAVRVAKNCCVSWKRRQKPEDPPPICEKAGVGLLSPSPHDILEAKDALNAMEEVVARLKPRERELFEMRQLEGLTLDEIVERTGIMKPSVKVMISTARKKVLTELKKRLRQ